MFSLQIYEDDTNRLYRDIQQAMIRFLLKEPVIMECHEVFECCSLDDFQTLQYPQKRQAILIIYKLC